MMNLFKEYPHSKCIRCSNLIAGLGNWHCIVHGRREYDGLYCEQVEWLSSAQEEVWNSMSTDIVVDNEEHSTALAIDVDDEAIIWSVHGYRGVMFKGLDSTLLNLFLSFIGNKDCNVHVQASDGYLEIQRVADVQKDT